MGVVYARGLCEPAVPRTAVQDVRQEQSCVLGGQAHAHRDGRYHRHCAVQGAFQVTLPVRACVRACVLRVGVISGARARTRMRVACTCTHIHATTDDIRHENGTRTYDVEHFAVQVSVNASTSSLFGGIKLKAESSWFLSAPGACGGGPTSTNQVRVRPSHMLASAPHVARCMLLLRVACCMVCVAAHAHTARPGGSVTQSRRRFGW